MALNTFKSNYLTPLHFKGLNFHFVVYSVTGWHGSRACRMSDLQLKGCEFKLQLMCHSATRSARC